jgi:hypothetical protein
MPDPTMMNDEERIAMGKVTEAMHAIQGLGALANQVELTAAVHVLQGFVIQHMLHRLSPEEFSDWSMQDIIEGYDYETEGLGGT